MQHVKASYNMQAFSKSVLIVIFAIVPLARASHMVKLTVTWGGGCYPKGEENHYSRFSKNSTLLPKFKFTDLKSSIL